MTYRLTTMAAALLVSAGTASAQDAQYNWSGVYIGISGGFANASGNLTDLFCDGVSPGHCVENFPGSPNFGLPGTWNSDVDSTDFVGSAFIGINRQFDNRLVLGLESDLGFGPTATGGFLYGGNFGDTDYDNDAQGKIDLGLQGTTRIRVGMALDRFMPFVTGGVAYSTFKATYSEPDNADAPRSGSGNFLGWTVGGGVNYLVTENIVVGAEYRFVDYGDDDFGITNRALDNDIWSYGADMKVHEGRLSLGVKF